MFIKTAAMLLCGVTVALSPCISPASASEVDARLISRLIAAECDGESDIVKISLAALVLNRTASDDYPNAVIEVILEKAEFESVNSGAWLEISEEKISAELYAVKLAMSGVDPTCGALIFSRGDIAAIRRPTLVLGEYIFGFSE